MKNLGNIFTLIKFDICHNLMIYLAKDNSINIIDKGHSPYKFFLRINKVIFVPKDNSAKYVVLNNEKIGRSAFHGNLVNSEANIKLSKSLEDKINNNSNRYGFYKYIDFYLQVNNGEMYVLRYNLTNQSNESLKSYLNIPNFLRKHEKIFSILKSLHILTKPSIYHKIHIDKKIISTHDKKFSLYKTLGKIDSYVNNSIDLARSNINDKRVFTNDDLYYAVQLIDNMKDSVQKKHIREHTYHKIMKYYNKYSKEKKSAEYDWPFNPHKKHSNWKEFADNVRSLHYYRYQDKEGYMNLPPKKHPKY